MKSIAYGHTILRSLTFKAGDENEDYACDLELVLAKSFDSDRCARIRFFGVSGLEISLLRGGVSQACGLVYEDIGDNQWDRLNYRVSDQEEDKIKFLCHSLEVDENVAI